MESRRLLHRNSQFGYTDRPEEALVEEPEAVSSSEQRRLTQEAQLRGQARRLADWMHVRDRVRTELDWLRTRPVVHGIESDVRVLERQLEKIDRRLRA